MGISKGISRMKGIRNKNQECDMVVTLTIPYVANNVSYMKHNLPKYLTQDCFNKGLVIVEDIKVMEVCEK